jgi:hypothetical protein
MVNTPGMDPLLWGNGSEIGPDEIRYSSETRRPRTFLAIAGL